MFNNLKELFAGVSVAAAEGSARTSRAGPQWHCWEEASLHALPLNEMCVDFITSIPENDLFQKLPSHPQAKSLTCCLKYHFVLFNDSPQDFYSINSKFPGPLSVWPQCKSDLWIQEGMRCLISRWTSLSHCILSPVPVACAPERELVVVCGGCSWGMSLCC